MHTFQMNLQVNENGILSVTLPKEWAKQTVNVLLIVEPLAQENKLNIADKFFEQLQLDDDFADDELALLFERDKDTGRDAL